MTVVATVVADVPKKVARDELVLYLVNALPSVVENFAND